MFSAGQKSKVTLGAAFWIKPHIIAMDEPTNYIDMETLDSLTVALQRFKGGVICISHSNPFVKKVCNEQWMLVDGVMTIDKGITDMEVQK
jgi:ATPase subunit of ABC transporter with duplicated ATPase domains